MSPAPEPEDLLEIVDLAPTAAAAVGEISGRWRVATWWRHAATIVALGVVVTVLLLNAKRSESALPTIAHAHPAWMVAIAGAAAVTYAMAAACSIGATTVRLAMGRTVVMQVASSFVNRFVPGGVGGAVLNVRYLERAGARRTEAVTANALNNAAGLAVHLALFLGLLPFFGGLQRDVDPPDDAGAYVVILVGLVAVGAAVWIRWIPQHWKGHLRAIQRAASDVLHDPRRLALLLLGSAGVALAHGAGLRCALRSVAARVAPTDVMVVYLVAAATASISPTPGGLGAIEVALVTGLTRTGTVEHGRRRGRGRLLYRLVTYWLPVLPDLIAFRRLRRIGAI
jgi:uncharacterized membrane protein YbhN (UPF0104 family)